MNGPGKYDIAATAAREATQAELLLLIVAEGNKGSGFSIQTLNPSLLMVIPKMLRVIADQIEHEQKERDIFSDN